MNYKHLFTILTICVCLAAPAMAVSAHYESKIVPTVTDAPITYGTLSGSIRCGYNTLTKEIGIKNDADPTGTYRYFPILPDGRFGEYVGDETKYDIDLIPGNFTLYLADGNGGQPEYSHAIIVAGQKSNPMIDLKGHAVSSEDKKTISPVPTITPSPDCHTHSIYIPGHFEYHCQKPHWRWVSGYWYSWTCCKHHCNDQG